MTGPQAAVVATLTLIPTAGAAVVRQGTGDPAGPYRRITIQLPDRWVPFSATIVNTDPAGNVSYGRLYRSADGSNTTVVPGTDGEPVVTLHHFPSRHTYAKFGRQNWIAYPFPNEKRTEPQRTIAADASRVRRLDIEVAGGPVYEFSAGVKRTRWAVALNGFPIYTLDSNGNTFELVDIVVGEPPAELVTPPAKANPGR